MRLLHFRRSQKNDMRHLCITIDLARNHPPVPGVKQAVAWRVSGGDSRVHFDSQRGVLIAKNNVQVAVIVHITKRHRP